MCMLTKKRRNRRVHAHEMEKVAIFSVWASAGQTHLRFLTARQQLLMSVGSADAAASDACVPAPVKSAGA